MISELKSHKEEAMTNGKMLRDKIDSLGISITFLANKIGCSRGHVYDIIGGTECTASEIIKFSEALGLTKRERDNIFLQKRVI